MKSGIGYLVAGVLLAACIAPATGQDGQTSKPENPAGGGVAKSGESKASENPGVDEKKEQQEIAPIIELPDDFDPAAAPIEFVNCTLPKAARESVVIPFARGLSNRTIFVFPVLLARKVRYFDGKTIYESDKSDEFLNQLALDDGKSGEAAQIEYEVDNLAIIERAAVAMALERQLGKQNISIRSPRFTEQQVSLHLMYDNVVMVANSQIPLTTGTFRTRFVLRDGARRQLCASLQDDPFRDVKKLQLELSMPYQVRAQVRVSSATMDTTMDAVATAIQEHEASQFDKPQFLIGIRGGKIDNNWLINEQLRTDVLMSFSRRRGTTGSLLSVNLLDKFLGPALENIAISEAKVKDRVIKFVSDSGFSATVSLNTITSLSMEEFEKRLKATEWQLKTSEDRQRDYGLEMSAVIPRVGTFTQKGNYNAHDKQTKDELDKVTLEAVKQIKGNLTGSITHVQALSIASFSSLRSQFDRYAQFLDVVDFNQISVAKYRIAVQSVPESDKSASFVNTIGSVPSVLADLDKNKPYLRSGGGWHSGSDYFVSANSRINYVPADGGKPAAIEIVVRVVVKLKIENPYGDASTWVREATSSRVALESIPAGWAVDLSKIAAGFEEITASATMAHTAGGYAELRGEGVMRAIQIYLSSNDDTGRPKGCLHFSVDFGKVVVPLIKATNE